jgi:hypothetical protein
LSLLLLSSLLVGEPIAALPAQEGRWRTECPARNRRFESEYCVTRFSTVDADLAIRVGRKGASIVLTSRARDPASREPCHLETWKPIPRHAAALPARVLVRRLNQVVTMMEAARECHVAGLPQLEPGDGEHVVRFLTQAPGQLQATQGGAP